ncbi:TetR/AcrR family transcriptional regulator [Actinokineospora sp. NBRC 105648]|uniref:TetR/AcrR family transcriptional regulator n=1 Tax=Actinokineospora sp. NBRC 105648 TaxID=3032206 RepID=UPI0024A01256|nr:TetR/AcrR family transcriptional regulator [Actinokineospora sp. NBRC 105648]GLZ39616.1 TetR family transcriptional regulator [Actinokineospora sp. NBRC 105648]
MSAVKSRREQYSDATRAALVAAATVRFATDGFRATGLEDVAADIQATRGAVYHHFSSKKALFGAVLDELEVQATARIGGAYATAPGSWAGAMAALEAFLDQCVDPVYSRVVWLEGPIALGWHDWHAVEAKYAHGTIEGILRDLLAAGRIDPLPLLVTTEVTFCAMGAAGHGLAHAAPADQPRLRAEYGEVIRRMVAGLLPGSGEPADDRVGQQAAP